MPESRVLAPSYPLHTGRLALRPYQEDDLAFLIAVRTDPVITRYVPFGTVAGEDEAREVLAQKIERQAFRRPGDAVQLVAALRDTGKPVGEATLAWTSEEQRAGEVGYLVHPGHQGRGYATEMSAQMLRLAFTDLALHRVTARIDARNTASAAVCERLGMRREAHLLQNEWIKGEWTDEVGYAMLVDEWPGSAAHLLARWEA